MNIYVANLSFDLQDKDLKDFFTPYGEVTSAKVIMDKMTERSRGFGFVEMSDDTAAAKAIAELNGSMVEGRPIKVSEAKAKPGKDFSGGGERSGGDRSGGDRSGGERNFNNPKSYNQTRY
ncbi:MAG TPA: RNA-binding protein [Puia sp.]|jgi:RNA recognition motif-containing protein|nr:RNA-binding protein [Puia sp.]